MLTKKNRLHTHKEIKVTFARGRAFFSPFYLGKFHKVLGETKKITFVVSTKVSKKAVARNRIKRLLRVAIKPYIAELQAGNYIFTVKPKAMELYDEGLVEAFELFLSKNKIINIK